MKFGLVVTLDLPDEIYGSSRTPEDLAAWVKLSYLDFGARFEGGSTDVAILPGGFPVGTLLCRICGAAGFSSPCANCEAVILRTAKKIGRSPAFQAFWAARPRATSGVEGEKSARGWRRLLQLFGVR